MPYLIIALVVIVLIVLISCIKIVPQAQAFVEYMDYRFAQGDFTQRYVIDEFIQDFSKLLQRGHSANSITRDFEQFLENRNQLSDRYQNMEGLTPDEFQSSWYEFMGD